MPEPTAKPTAPLALTMGDPAGVGPEICAKAIAAAPTARPVAVLGDLETLRAAAEAAGLEFRPIETPEAAVRGLLCALQCGPALAPVALGEISPACGQAAYDAIRAGIDLARDGRVAALVTAPIHKESLSAAGIPFPGHTEMLAHYGGAERVAMMLANDEIRTVLVTIHVSLRDAIEQADFPAQMNAIRLAHQGARAFGIPRPRVAVAGLNPHAGEGGLFGREEIEIIAPAIEAARAEGIDASGPWPGDTVFMQARTGRFDVVVAQYHDQGLIPVKYLGLAEGVNVTLGLPFIRTSPDHGTAFDIAGRGVADPASLITAVRQADRLIAARENAA